MKSFRPQKTTQENDVQALEGWTWAEAEEDADTSVVAPMSELTQELTPHTAVHLYSQQEGALKYFPLSSVSWQVNQT